MTQRQPAPEVDLLWQAAKLINGAAGGLDVSAHAENAHFERWYDVAETASTVAEQALAIATANMTADDAAAQLMNIDVEAADPADDRVPAYAAIVELSPPDPADTGRALTVGITGDYHRTITAGDNQGQAVPARTPRRRCSSSPTPCIGSGRRSARWSTSTAPPE